MIVHALLLLLQPQWISLKSQHISTIIGPLNNLLHFLQLFPVLSKSSVQFIDCGIFQAYFILQPWYFTCQVLLSWSSFLSFLCKLVPSCEEAVALYSQLILQQLACAISWYPASSLFKLHAADNSGMFLQLPFQYLLVVRLYFIREQKHLLE